MADNKVLEILLTAKDEASKVLKNFGGSLETAGKAVKSAGAVLGKLAIGVGAVGTASIAGATAIFGFANKTAEATDRIDKMSQSLGFSKKGFQELDYMLGQNGASIDSLGAGIKTLTNNMVLATDKTSEQANTFKKLGVSVTDTTGKMKSQEQLFKDVVIAFEKMENGTQKNVLAQQLFGKSAQDLMPTLNQQAGSMEGLISRANELGLVMSDSTVTAGVVLGDTMDDIKKSFTAVATTIGAEVLPLVQQFADFILTNVVPVVMNFAKYLELVITDGDYLNDGLMQFDGTMKTVVKTIGIVIAFLRDVAINMYNFIRAVLASETFKIVLQIITDAFKQLWAVVLELWEALQPYVPFFQLLAQIVGVVLLGAFLAFINIIKIVIVLVTSMLNMFREAYLFIRDNLVKAIATDLSNAFKAIGGVFDWLGNKVKEIFTGMKSFIQPVIDMVSGLIGKLSSAIDMIKSVGSGVSNAVSGAVSSVTSFFGGGKATGGNVYSNRAYMVGERGSEMFIPSQNGTIIPNNKLGGNGTSINITVTGNQLLDERAGDKIGDMIINKLKYQLNLS